MRRARSLAAVLLLLLLVLAPLPTEAAAEPPLPSWSWHSLRGGEVADIAFSRADPSVVYVGIEVNQHAAYKSLDGGRTWTRLDGPGDHAKVIAASPRRADVAYFALSESLHATDLDVETDAESLYGNPRDGDDTQVILSSGTSAGPSSASFIAIVVHPEDDARLAAAIKGGNGRAPTVYLSSDGGATWTTREPAVEQITALAFDPSDAARFYVGTREVMAMDDSGALATLTHLSDFVVSIDTSSAAPRRVIAATEREVVVSDDAGATWRDATGPLVDIHRVVSAPSAPDTLYASTFAGVFRSDDAGRTWRNASGDLRALNVQAIAVHPEDADVVLIGNSGLWSSVRAEHRWRHGMLAHQAVWRTEDGGATWTRSDEGIEELSIEEVVANPYRDHEVWVGPRASRGGYRTDDGGHSWRVTQTPTLHYPMRVRFDPTDPDRVFATSWHTGGPFASSDDGGASWRFVSEGTFFDALDTGRHLYRGNGGGGANLHIHGLALDPTDPDVIYVGTVHDADNPAGFPLEGAHVFKSTDGGATWRESDDGFPHEAATAIHDMLVDPHEPRRVFAATTAYESESERGLWVSEDAGATWREANEGLGSLDAWAIVAHEERPGVFALAAGDGVYVSEDAGASWRRTLESPATDLVGVASAPDVLYAATSVGVSRSLDFGETWTDASDGLPDGAAVYAVAADGAHATLFASLDDGGLYRAQLADVAPLDLPSAWSATTGGGHSHDGPGGAPPPGAPPEGGAGDGGDRDDRFGEDDRRDGRGEDAPTPALGVALTLGIAALAAVMLRRRA